MHTTRSYGWDFYTLLRFRLITLEKQGCFLAWLGLGWWGVNVLTSVNNDYVYEYEQVRRQIQLHEVNDQLILVVSIEGGQK